MKTRFSLLFLLLCFQLFGQQPQPYDWIAAMQQPNANFDSICMKAQIYFDSFPNAEGRKAFSRWAVFWNTRASYADTTSSFQPYLNAVGEYFDGCEVNTICEETLGSSFLANWQACGPQDITDLSSLALDEQGIGRTVRARVDLSDPTFNTIIIGTETSGLWKTTNALSAPVPTWTHLTKNIRTPTIGVYDFEIDPFDSDNIFIATGSGNASLTNNFGFGILKSTDGGTTWCPTNTPPFSEVRNNICRDIVPNPFVQDEWYVLNGMRLYKSIDGLSSVLCTDQNDPIYPDDPNNNGCPAPYYNPSFTPGLTSAPGVYLHELVFHPSNANVMYLSSNDRGADGDTDLTSDCPEAGDCGADLWRSTDGGENFVSLEIHNILNIGEGDMERIDIAVDLSGTTGTEDQLFIAVSYLLNGAKLQAYLYSNDQGNTFDILSLTAPGSWFMLDHKKSPNFDKVYLGAPKLNEGVINFTLGQINSWNLIANNDLYVDHREVQVYNRAGNDFILSANDGGVGISEDGGVTWKNITGIGLNIAQFYGIGVGQNGQGLIGGCQDVAFYFKNQGVWERIDGLDASTCIVDPHNPRFKYGMEWNDPARLIRRIIDNNKKDYDDNLSSILPEGINNHFREIAPLDISSERYLYFGGKQLYRRAHDHRTTGTLTTTWEPVGDLSSFPGDYHFITEIKVAPSDPDVIYVAKDWYIYEQTTGSALQKGFFRITNHSNGINATVEDLTDPILAAWGGSNLFTSPFGDWGGGKITGIAVDPTDPDRLWISLSSYGNPYKVVHIYKDGSNWAIQNVSEGLPNFPINDIVYQPGTTDGLYVATDVGVWFNPDGDNPTSEWICYNTNFPVTYVYDLEIDECQGDLYAGTFGLGIWKSPLATTSTEPTRITDDVVWDYQVNLYRDLIIESGASLTVKDTVNISQDKKIIVEPNARLIVDGGTLTNDICNRGAMWEGIIVQGSSTDHQSINIVSGERDQGLVITRNESLIEHAKHAVRLYDINTNGTMISGSSGGIIWASNTEFRNNGEQVSFKDYQNFDLLNPNNLIGNSSFFKDCTFKINNDFLGNYSALYSMIWLEDVTGIEFYGCDFLDESTNNNLDYAEDRINAINAYDANFTVTASCQALGYPCIEFKNSNFSNFYQAISASNTSSINTFVVSRTNFTDNHTGIISAGVDFPYVVLSNFQVGASLPPFSANNPNRGIYMYGCSGYTIEENTLSKSAVIPIFEKPVGICIADSGNNPNEVYLNTLSNLAVANLSNGKNVNPTSDNQGLVYLCNTNTSNGYDFAVPDEGLGVFQGVSTQQRDQSNLATGNQLSLVPIFPESHFINEINSLIIQYHYFAQATNEDLESYSINSIIPIQASFNQCSSRLPSNEETAELSNLEKNNYSQQLNGSANPQEKFQAGKMLIRDHLMDSTKMDLVATRNTLEILGGIRQQFKKVDSYLQESKLDSANFELNLLSASETQMDSIDLLEWQYFEALKTLQTSALSLGLSESTWVTNEKDSLLTIGNTGNLYASVQAQNLVNQIFPNTFDRPITLPLEPVVEERENTKETTPIKDPSSPWIAIAPNPTQGMVQITFLQEGDSDWKEGELWVIDMKGNVVLTRNCTISEGKIMTLDLTNLVKGLYSIQIRANNGIGLDTQSLFIE